MKSIMQRNFDRCYLCGKPANAADGPLELHHVFSGMANRKKSTQYGLTVRLHAFSCHREGRHSVHKDADVSNKLKMEAQRVFEVHYGDRDKFRQEFGRSWL